MTDERRVPLNRIERILATMIAAVTGVSILAIAVVLVAGASGVELAAGAWPLVVALPLPGLAIAFLLILVFATVSVIRRRRLAQDGGE